MKKTNFDFGDLVVTNQAFDTAKTTIATPLSTATALSSTETLPVAKSVNDETTPAVAVNQSQSPETKADMTVTAPPSQSSDAFWPVESYYSGNPELSALGLKTGEWVAVLGVLAVIVLAIIVMRK